MDVRPGWRLVVVILGFSALAACAGGDGARAEAACREQGYMPGTMAFAECLHPQDTEELERAREAWERDADGQRR